MGLPRPRTGRLHCVSRYKRETLTSPACLLSAARTCQPRTRTCTIAFIVDSAVCAQANAIQLNVLEAFLSVHTSALSSLDLRFFAAHLRLLLVVAYRLLSYLYTLTRL